MAYVSNLLTGGSVDENTGVRRKNVNILDYVLA